MDAHQPLNRLGIDFLMAVELKNRVEADLETSVPVTALLQGPSLSQLATQLLEGLDAPAADATLAPEEAEDGIEAQVEGLTDEEVDALLRDLGKEEERPNDERSPRWSLGAREAGPPRANAAQEVRGPR